MLRMFRKCETEVKKLYREGSSEGGSERWSDKEQHFDSVDILRGQVHRVNIYTPFMPCVLLSISPSYRPLTFSGAAKTAC